MSLKTDYFDGITGLHHKLNDAYDAGVAYVGGGQDNIDLLDLNDRNGSNLGAGSGIAGFYFDCSSISNTYRVYMVVSGEIAPPVTNQILVPVALAGGDNNNAVATKIKNALNAITNEPFAATSLMDVVQIQSELAGVSLASISAGTLGGTAAVSQLQAGVGPSGNFTTLQQALLGAAAQGSTKFTCTITGTGSVNAGYLRANKGQNLLLKAFLAGIVEGLASQSIYSYECTPALNVSDTVDTKIDFNFNFQTT